MWVVVKIMVPFLRTLNIRCRIKYYRDPKRDHNFDNRPCVARELDSTIVRNIHLGHRMEAMQVEWRVEIRLRGPFPTVLYFHE